MVLCARKRQRKACNAQANPTVPPYISQFTEPAQWRRVSMLASIFPTISVSDFQKRGGDSTDCNLLVIIDSDTGEARLPVIQLEEDGITIQPQVCQMMDLMHRRGANPVQIALWWFEPRPELGGASPAGHLEVTNNRSRMLVSVMQAGGPYYWVLKN